MRFMARRFGIRAWLFAVAVAATLPAMLLTGYVGKRWAEAERDAQFEQLARRAEAGAAAVERRIETVTATLVAIAESEAMRRDDFAAVHGQASRVLHRRGGGAAIVLAARDGSQVFNTRWPFGTSLPPVHIPTMAPVFSSNKPYVSDLFATISAGILVTTVSLPILREGQAVYALRLSLETADLAAVLQEQQLPSDWIGVLIDRSGIILARTHGAALYVGQKGAPELLTAAAQGERGRYHVVVKEGVHMQAAYSKVPSSGWTVAVGVPEATLEQPLWDSVWTAFFAGTALLIIGFTAATLGARAIERQAAALAGVAKALGGGERPVLPPSSGVREFADIGGALESASELLEARESEREWERRSALAAKAEAEMANTAKSRFLAAASHDLRQPFQAMRLFYEVLLPHVSATGIVAAARLNDAMRAGEDLLSSLLDVSTLDAGTVKITYESVVITEVLAGVASECEPLAQDKGLRLRWLPCSAKVVSDRVLLVRMVRNLVINAIRYTDHGGVVLGCRRRGNRLVIQVWDSGIGIADSHLPHLFEDFFQVQNAERDRAKGLGLGLAVVARMGRLLGHHVTVRSRPGHGSVFSITLQSVGEESTDG